ncbi:MAG: sporulation protein YqfC [Defluviitaleaceae bacterium]|nr:sporulation protein YqfC [Defluviitaleaceae bacterium]
MKKIEKISDKLELPRELVLDLPVIKMISNESVTVQNYKQILEYTENFLRLKVKNGVAIIEGESLVITKIDKEQIEIKGVIKNCGIL